MKTLNLERMEEIEGGKLTPAEACGIGTGILVASIASGVGVIWGFAAFAATCLTSDSN